MTKGTNQHFTPPMAKMGFWMKSETSGMLGGGKRSRLAGGGLIKVPNRSQATHVQQIHDSEVRQCSSRFLPMFSVLLAEK